MNTRNPVYNEAFHFLVFDPEVQKIEVTLSDYDTISYRKAQVRTSGPK